MRTNAEINAYIAQLNNPNAIDAKAWQGMAIPSTEPVLSRCLAERYHSLEGNK